jgi:hypothetical protein
MLDHFALMDTDVRPPKSPGELHESQNLTRWRVIRKFNSIFLFITCYYSIVSK